MGLALGLVSAQPPQPPEQVPPEKLPATREAVVQWIKAQARVGDLSCTLSLGDGTVLRGELEPWEGGPSVLLRTRLSAQPLQVSLDDVASLRFRDQKGLPLVPPAGIGFRDGTWVIGASALLLDDKSLRFSTPYVDQLEVPRGAVAEVRFVPGTPDEAAPVAAVATPMGMLGGGVGGQRLLLPQFAVPAVAEVEVGEFVGEFGRRGATRMGFGIRPLADPAAGTIGRLWLQRGDVISGRPLSISADAVTFRMDLGPEVTVPLGEVTRLSVPPEAWTPQPAPADRTFARATLITGEVWNGAVEKLDAKGLQLGWHGGKSVVLPLGLLHLVAELETGVQGLRQWAVAAKASSEYGNPGWSAMQAAGPPDTMVCADSQTAWASRSPDGGLEWLELSYATPVHATRVRVRESYNPGAVIRVEAVSTAGETVTLWEGADPTRQCPGWLDLRFAATKAPVQTIRVHLDVRLVPSWNEIDAVELIGTP
jgi:hypothetical protein